MKNFAQSRRIHLTRKVSINSAVVLRTAILILVPNILLWTGIISEDGLIMTGDLNFPITNENFVKYYFPLWNDLTSQNNFDRIQRLPMMSPFIALAAMGLDVSIVVKLFFISTYTLLTFSMYLFLQSVQRQLTAKKVAIFGTSVDGRSWIFSLLGGFIFAYNPVSFQFGGPTSILFSLGILPLMLYIVLTRFHHRYFPLYIAGLLLLSTGHPFTLIMNAVIALIFLIVIHIRHVPAKVILHKVLLSAVTFTLLFAWYWIPYFTDTPIYADTEAEERMSRSGIDAISNNDPLKIFLLERDRFLYVDTVPNDFPLTVFHYASLVLIVGAGVLGIFILKIKKIQTVIPLFCLVGMNLSVLFALGTKGPLGDLYFNIVSYENIGWIFRSSLKFQLYESFFVAALFGISLSLLSKGRRRIIRFIIILLGLTSLLGASFYGIYNANFITFNPIIIPNEYYEIRYILATEDGLNKVVYYPLYSGPTEWSKGHVIGRFDMKSSPVPTYFVSQNQIDDMLALPYLKFLSEDIRVIPFRTPSFYEYLSSVGVKYIVFHQDRISDRPNSLDDENLLYLLNSDKAQLRYNKAGWYLFELKAEPSPPVNIPSVNILENDQSNITRSAKSDLVVVRPFPSDTTIGGHFVETSLPFKMNIKAISENSPSNYAFGLLDNYFRNWHAQNGTSGMYLSLTRDNQIDTLLITKNSGNREWLLSSPINVTQDDALFFSLHMKTEDAQGVGITMFGYFPNEGKWREIDRMVSGLTGDKDWKEYWSIVDTSQNMNMSMLRYGINPGSFSPEFGELLRIWIKSPELVSLKSDVDPNDNNILEYRKINPYQWLVRVNVSDPYILTLTETFDRGWIASMPNGEVVESTLVNGMINGFYIDKIGTYDILLHYRPQSNFELGVIISLVTLASYVGYYLLTRKQHLLARSMT
jgi:hypothetical protein